MADDLLSYPTAKQMLDFKRLRVANFVSMFRMAKCPICHAEMPNAFMTCSRECHGKLLSKDPSMTITWTIDLTALLQGEHRIETHEGSVRSGKITKVNYHETQLPGKVVKIPKTIELGGDAGDYVTWETIKEIKRI